LEDEDEVEQGEAPVDEELLADEVVLEADSVLDEVDDTTGR